MLLTEVLLADAPQHSSAVVEHRQRAGSASKQVVVERQALLAGVVRQERGYQTSLVVRRLTRALRVHEDA